MRKVTILYEDGTTAEYPSLGKAAEALRCTPFTIQRLANDLATTLHKAHKIASVTIDQPKGKSGDKRKRGQLYDIKCTNEKTGRVVIAHTLKEAKKLTRWPCTTTALHYACDRHEYRHGWMYDSIPRKLKRDTYADYSDSVSESTIHRLYGMAYRLANLYSVSSAVKQDAVQTAVIRVSNMIASGLRDRICEEKGFDSGQWEWCNLRFVVRNVMNKELKYINRKIDDDGNHGELSMDDWIEMITPTYDSDWSFMREMPDHLKQLAMCYIRGMGMHEIDAELQIEDHERRRLTNELRKWMIDNGFHK